MQFLYPSFLWALAIIAVPIIIHLFYFRRFKKVYFTNVRFLKNIKEETAARSRLKNLLVLLSRILALVALVLAFCLPFLHNDEARIGKKASSIFIDNSFSMESKAADVILLEKAKAYAGEVINSHNEDDLIQVLTHDFEGQHQRLVDREEALNLIEEITIGPSVKTLSEIEKRQKQVLSSENVEYRNLYWISDFQQSIVDIDSLPDTLYQHYVMPLQSVEESNVSIDSAWFASPVARLSESNTIFVKMTNRGNSTAENVRLSAIHEGQEKPINVLDFEPGMSLTDTFNLSISNGGWQHVQIKLTDHPVTFDDTYYLAFEAASKIDILVVSDDSRDTYLQQALESMSAVVVDNQSARQVDYASFNEMDMVILEGLSTTSTGLINELKSFVINGGNLLIFPPSDPNTNEYNKLFSSLGANQIQKVNKTDREVTEINTFEFIFNDVFSRVDKNVRLPKASLSFDFNRSGRNEEVLLKFRDGGAYMSKFKNEKGRTYVSASPIDKSVNSLVQNAEIFIPMLYKMALSTSESTKMSYTIGRDELIEIPGQWNFEDRVPEITGMTTFIPGMSRIGRKTLISINNQIEKQGVYDLKTDDEIVRKLAFNYDRNESELKYLSPQDLQDLWGQNAQIITSQNQTSLAQLLKESEEGQPLWKWLLIFTLIMLAIEQLLLRLWKI